MGEDRIGGVQRNFGADLTAADERPAATGEGLAPGRVLQLGTGTDGQARGVETAAGTEGQFDPLQPRGRGALGAANGAAELEGDRYRALTRKDPGEILPSKETTTSGRPICSAPAGPATMASSAIAAARRDLGASRRFIRISRT